MPGNRRRHANALPIASFATWLVIGLFACGAGLGYVWCKNRLHETGRQIELVERELRDLRNRNVGLQTKIASLSSTDALNRRYEDGSIKLVPIRPDRIVVLNSKPLSGRESELQKVANPTLAE
jgi:hypothetical protein